MGILVVIHGVFPRSEPERDPGLAVRTLKGQDNAMFSILPAA